MKINYKAVAGGGAYLSLMDDTVGDTCESLNPSCSFRNQATPLASTGGPQSQFMRFLDNSLETLSFKINKAYPSAAAALAASRTMIATFKQQVHIQVIQDTETQYYPNATIESLGRDVQGQSVTYSFQFKSQSVQPTAP